jgi:predicted porin
MNKKLMAVAVAGVLAAPAGAAMAQTSTVQMYGLFNVEYAPWVDQPDHSTAGSRTNVDALNSGASRIGFRGQEKLGGGLTAWFQCETTISPLNGSAPDDDAELYDNNSHTNWCDRNSAIGLRGGWGNFYIGLWDSPAKRVTSATRMLNETGWLGVQRHLMTLAGWGYSHRVTRALNYDSPNFGGFSVAFQMTTNDANKNQTDVGEPLHGTDGRIYGLNGMYRSGPLVAGLAYQKYEDQVQFLTGGFPSVSPTPGLVSGADDTVWVFGINYTFGNFKVGFVATDLDAERNNLGTANFERRNYNVALDWRLGGPHSVLFGWTHAGETEGSGVGPASTTAGSANVYQVSYKYTFSKRTSGRIGYITVDNGDGGVHSLQGLSTNMRPGERSSAFSLQLTHSF